MQKTSFCQNPYIRIVSHMANVYRTGILITEYSGSKPDAPTEWNHSFIMEACVGKQCKVDVLHKSNLTSGFEYDKEMFSSSFFWPNLGEADSVPLSVPISESRVLMITIKRIREISSLFTDN